MVWCIFWWAVLDSLGQMSCGAFVSTRTAHCLFSLTHCRTCNLTITWSKSIYHTTEIKTPQTGCSYFWWEWLDSNQLRLKPTDLQSAPALQLRRTPNPLVRAAGIEPAFQAWKACILAFVLCPQQIQSLTIIYYLDIKSSILF